MKFIVCSLFFLVVGIQLVFAQYRASEARLPDTDNCLVAEVQANQHLNGFLAPALARCYDESSNRCVPHDDTRSSAKCWCYLNATERCPPVPIISQIEKNEQMRRYLVEALLPYRSTSMPSISCNPFRAFSAQHAGCATRPYTRLNSTSCQIEWPDLACSTRSKTVETVAEIFNEAPNVCALIGVDPHTRTYRPQTQLFADAKAQNSLILHQGDCGLCSTTQDLAVYLRGTDLSGVGHKCQVAGGFLGPDSWKCKIYSRSPARSDPEDERNKSILDDEMLQCWRDADTGLTDECIKIWAWDTISASCGECATPCLHDKDLSCGIYNDPKTGELCDCLECDHQCYDPIFTKYTGLTRRRAGMISEVGRNCTDVYAYSWTDFDDQPVVPATPKLLPKQKDILN